MHMVVAILVLYFIEKVSCVFRHSWGCSDVFLCWILVRCHIHVLGFRYINYVFYSLSTVTTKYLLCNDDVKMHIMVYRCIVDNKNIYGDSILNFIFVYWHQSSLHTWVDNNNNLNIRESFNLKCHRNPCALIGLTFTIF